MRRVLVMTKREDWFDSFLDNSLVGASTLKEVEVLFRGDNRKLAIKLIILTQGFRQYWPMTLRAFYYQAVAALLVPNNQAQYKRVGNALKVLRRQSLIPWRAMEDKTRSTTNKRGMSDVQEYINESFDRFLEPNCYQRCYIQDQPVYVEISVEKDALSTHIKKAAWMHCTRVSVVKGQVSATMLNDIGERFQIAINKGLEPILIHFGDLDPTGVQIPKSMQKGLYEHHGIDVDVRQIGLTPEQCIEFDLPQSLDPPKEDDPNIIRWYDEYGDQSPTELDALHPEQLKQIVVAALDDIYDTDEMDEQREIEQIERDTLTEMRQRTIDFLDDEFPEYMEGVL